MGQTPGLSTCPSPEAALVQTVRDQVTFLAHLWKVLVLEVHQGEEEVEEDTSLLTSVANHLLS